MRGEGVVVAGDVGVGVQRTNEGETTPKCLGDPVGLKVVM